MLRGMKMKSKINKKPTAAKNSRITVCLVGPTPPPYGGIPTYVQTLLDASIPEVEYLIVDTKLPDWVAPANREGKTEYGSFFENGLFTGLKKVLFSIFHYFVFIRALLISKPQIVQVFTCSYWGYWRNLLYVMIAKLFGKRTIFHLLNAIDEFYNNSGKLGKGLLKFSFQVADGYLLQSPGLKKWLDQFTKRQTYGLWNCIDLALIPNRPTSGKEGENHFLTGITVGKLGKNKGTYDILEAIKKMVDSGTQIKWIFVGAGNIEEFNLLATEKGILENVKFTGPVSDSEKWKLLFGADFFCLPSYAEGQPISIIEAMSIGLPVISTPVGSIPEMITDLTNGILIPAGDVEKLVDAVKKMSDKDFRRSISKNAREIARTRYDQSQLFSSLVKIYTSLVIP